MKNAAFQSKTLNGWKQRGREQICYPLGSCTDAYVPFGGAATVPERHCSGQTCVHPAAAGLSLLLPSSGSKEGCSPVHQHVGRSPTRGHQEGFGSCLGSPLASPLLPTMALLQLRCLGNICGKSRGEGGFYQSQGHHEEELSLCLNGAKVTQALHQQGLET